MDGEVTQPAGGVGSVEGVATPRAEGRALPRQRVVPPPSKLMLLRLHRKSVSHKAIGNCSYV